MNAAHSLVRGWWEKVTVILWGETARLAAADPAVRERIVLAMEQGVKFSACITCAKELGVEQALRRQLLFLPVPDLTFFVDVALYNGKRQARGQGGTQGDGDLSG